MIEVAESRFTIPRNFVDLNVERRKSVHEGEIDAGVALRLDLAGAQAAKRKPGCVRRPDSHAAKVADWAQRL